MVKWRVLCSNKIFEQNRKNESHEAYFPNLPKWATYLVNGDGLKAVFMKRVDWIENTDWVSQPSHDSAISVRGKSRLISLVPDSLPNQCHCISFPYAQFTHIEVGSHNNRPRVVNQINHWVVFSRQKGVHFLCLRLQDFFNVMYLVSQEREVL